jgi:hypothetical protein
MAKHSLLHNTVDVKLQEGYRLWVAFDDGTAGVVDFSEWQPFRGVLAPLAQREMFAKVFIDPESKTLAWPTPMPVDADPVWLYCRANRIPLPQWT